MTRFDVFRFNEDVPLVVEVQADLLSHLRSVVVVPLMPITDGRGLELARLCPTVRVGGEPYRLMTTDIAGIPRTLLGEKVSNLTEQRDVLVAALDFLMDGF